MNLPKFNSEEDDAEQAEKCSLQNFAKSKKDGDGNKQKTGSPLNAMTADHQYSHKESSSQKVMLICSYEVSSDMNQFSFFLSISIGCDLVLINSV